MEVTLKQGVFRFILLSRINELMQHREIVISSVKDSLISKLTPKTSSEITAGSSANVNPKLIKEVDEILSELNVFALTGGDSERMAGSESTASSEISSDNYVANLVSQTIILKSVLGFLSEDANDTTATDLQNSFNSYLDISREIASWSMYLNQMKNNTTVSMGGSSLSLLMKNWGPVGLSEDMEDKYNRLYDHIYFLSLSGKVKALLDSDSVGIKVKQVEEEYSFDQAGAVTINIPPDADFNYIDFLCKVDYVIRTSKIDSYVDLGYDVSYDFGSNSFTVTITTVDGKPACQIEVVDPPLPDNPPPLPPPPIVPPLPSPPVPQPPSDCLPLALSFVIDFSGSMVDYSRYGASKGIIQWIDQIMKNSSQGGVTYSDYASIIKFSGRRKDYTNINISQDLTDDKSLLRQAVQNPYSSMEKTPIWDACMVSMKALVDQISDIPNYSLYNLVLILFTDGCDNISVATPDDVITYAVENNIMIFSIGMVNRFQGYTFFEETNIKKIAEEVDGEYHKLDKQSFNTVCNICDNTCYSQVCPSCDGSCDNEGCSLCNFTCYGQVCTTCHNQHYAVTRDTCDSACYQEICYYCHNTSYSRCFACDIACYSQEGCTVCNKECYSERCWRCDNTCYTDRTSCSICDATCYHEKCSTCYSCYAEEQCQSCDNTCYGDSCNCNTTCYGYSSCISCNSTCYSYIDGVCIQEQDSGGCSCNATGYGSDRCICNNTCYNQQCTECHSSFYGNTTCYKCDNTCYSDISGCTTCNNECYSEKCSSCHNAIYDQVCSICHHTCYRQTCICNNTCYGEHCSACDHTCYGECTICDEACYLQTCQTCDGSCYQGNVCNTCDNTCNLERCTSCHNTCYSSYESTDIYDTYKETISSACDIVKIKAEKTVADFSANIIEGSNPLTVVFSNTSTGSVYGYSWSFGNGNTSTVENPPAVTYTDAGVYTVRLKTTGLISDYDDEEIKEAYIKIWAPQNVPVAAFQANIVEGDVPLLVQFSDQTTGYYSRREINFGDGNVQIETNPELLTAKFFNRRINHVYQSIGIYTVKLIVSGPGGRDSVTRTAYIKVIECELISSGKLKVGYTLIEKYDIPDRQGIIYYKLDFTVKNWTMECMPDCVNLSAINPEGIIPIAIVDLKYTALSGSGVTAIPIKVGESVPWAPSGFLRGEITYTRSGDTKVNLSFRAKTTFPDPGDTTIITAPEIGSYTFTEANNILGIEDTNSIIRLIKFEVPEGSSSVTYTVGQVCNIINNVFDEEIIALPDKFGRLVLFTKRGEYLRIVGIDNGSTANSIFGFYEFGEINTPDYGSEVEYTITLYLVGVLVGNTIDSSLSPTLQEYKEHKIVHGTMEFNSYNWYQDRYGKIPPEIGGSLFTTPGHRILGIGGITLTKVEAFEDPIYNKIHDIDDNGVLPYWEDMKVGSIYNNSKYNIWNLGDDKRFFTRTFLDFSDSIYCIMGNYKFMAPGPVLPYRLTALIAGPYNLGNANSCDKICYPGESESRNRFIAIRKVALDGVNGIDWYFIELPYGILTAYEIISTMQRNDYQVIGSIATYSPTNITMTTALLDQNGYLVIGKNEGSLTTDIKFEDVEDKLRISIPNDDIYGIRLGGAPELVFANEIFGWNTLGEFGDPVSNAFYYKYTYEVDAYIDTSMHPSTGYKQTLIPEGTNLSAYSIVLNAADIDKTNKIEAVYLNLLVTVFNPKLLCLDVPIDNPIIPVLPPGGGVVPESKVTAKTEAENNAIAYAEAGDLTKALEELAKAVETEEDKDELNILTEEALYDDVSDDIIEYAKETGGFPPPVSIGYNLPIITSITPGDIGLTTGSGETGLTPDETDLTPDETDLTPDETSSTSISGATYNLPGTINIIDYPFIIPPCTPITFNELTVDVPCVIDLVCEQNFPFTELANLITQITNDPILYELGVSIKLANPTDTINGKDTILTALNKLLTIDYVNDPTATPASRFDTKPASSITDITIFSLKDLIPHINSLITNIQNKWSKDYFNAIKDIAQFIVSYVTLYNSTCNLNGVEYKIPIVSDLFENYKTATIAKYSMLNYAIETITAILDCSVTKTFIGVADKIIVVYPIALDSKNGEESIPDIIKIENRPYKSIIETENLPYDPTLGTQITVRMEPTIKSTLVGVISEWDLADTILKDLPYVELDIDGDPFDSTGEVTPFRDYIIDLPDTDETTAIQQELNNKPNTTKSKAIPIYYEINDAVQVGSSINSDGTDIKNTLVNNNDGTFITDEGTLIRSTLIKNVTWYPKLNRIKMRFFGITESSLILNVEDCIVLAGTETYTFETSIHDENITIDLTQKTKIMLDDLLIMLKSAFQPLTVTLSTDKTTITISGDSVVINIISKPAVDPLNSYIDYGNIDFNMNVKIYYGYLNTSEDDASKGDLIPSVSQSEEFPAITYEEDSTG